MIDDLPSLYHRVLDARTPWSAIGKPGDAYKWRFIALDTVGGGSAATAAQVVTDAQNFLARNGNICALELQGDSSRDSYSTNPLCVNMASALEKKMNRSGWIATGLAVSALVLSFVGVAADPAWRQKRRKARR